MRHDWVLVPAAKTLGLPERYKCRACWQESKGLAYLNGSEGFFPPCKGHTDRTGRDAIGLKPKDTLLPASK